MSSPTAPTSPLRVTIVGATGYTARELVLILADHPAARLVSLYASATGAAARGPVELAAIHPRLRGVAAPPVCPVDVGAVRDDRPDVAFLCTPHEAAADLAPRLLELGVVVIDLSAAFRLPDAALYPAHYGFGHPSPELLSRAVFGLTERNRAAVAQADLIANPGCYPTASLLAMLPVLERGLQAPGARPIVDAVSGVSGAGRSPSEKTHFANVSLGAYAVGSHRHAPEIAAHAGAPVVFTPHLAEFERGILATVHLPLAPGVTAADVRDAFAGAYADEPFVRVLDEGVWPAVGDVRHTNRCDIGVHVDEAAGHAIVIAVIDNLVKGASGQAVQNMNARFGLPETLGLAPGASAAGGVLA